MYHVLSRRFHHCTGEFEARGYFAVDADLAGQKERIREPFGQLDLDVECLTGADHTAEFRVVQPRDDRNRCWLDQLHFCDEHRCRLKGCFALQNPRQKGLTGVMSGEHIESRVEKLAGVDATFGDLNHFIQPQKRRPVRNELLNFVAVHSCQWSVVSCGGWRAVGLDRFAGIGLSLFTIHNPQFPHTRAVAGVRYLSTSLATITP